MLQYLSNEIANINQFQVIGILLLFFAGFHFLKLLLKEKYTWFSWYMSIPTGFGIASILMTLLAYFQIKITYEKTAIIMLLFSVLMLFFRRKEFINSYKNIKKPTLKSILANFKNVSITHTLLMLSIWTILVFVFIKSTYWQPISWDVLTSFDLHGKAIAHEGKILHSLFRGNDEVGLGVAYTPMVSMSYAYLYLFEFEFPKVFPPIILAACCMIFYHLLKMKTNKIWSAVITILFVLTPELCSHGAICQTNLTLALFAFASFVSFVFWQNDRANNNLLYLTLIMASLASWVRSEGILVLGLFLFLSFVVLFINKENKKHFYIAAACSLLPFITWLVYLTNNAESFEKFTQATISLSKLTFWNPDKLQVIYDFIALYCGGYGVFGITFHLTAIMMMVNVMYFIFLKIRKKEIRLNIGHLALLCGLLLWFGYMFLIYELYFPRGTDAEQAKQLSVIGSSFKRYLFVVIPFFWIYIGANDMTHALSSKLNKLIYG